MEEENPLSQPTPAPAVPPVDPAAQFRLQQEELSAAALAVLQSGRYIGGPEVEELEREVAALCGVSYGVGVNSGTDALILALMALGIGPGDEVILPSFTFFACLEAVVRVGAHPAFADIDRQTFCLDPASVERLIGPDTRAVMAVHLYGHPAPMEELGELCRRHRLVLIEDLAQALGAKLGDRPVGSFGQAGAISFYPTKNLGACGDGGMVVTDDPEVARRVRQLANHGQTDRYTHLRLGMNSRLDALQAALLRVKLRRLGEITEKKRQIADFYRRELSGLPLILPEERAGAYHVYHQFTVLIRGGRTERDRLLRALRERRITAMVYYPRPIHQQPAMAEVRNWRQDFLGVTEEVAASCLSLPIYAEMSPAQLDHVVESVRETLSPG